MMSVDEKTKMNVHQQAVVAESDCRDCADISIYCQMTSFFSHQYVESPFKQQLLYMSLSRRIATISLKIVQMACNDCCQICRGPTDCLSVSCVG